MIYLLDIIHLIDIINGHLLNKTNNNDISNKYLNINLINDNPI